MRRTVLLIAFFLFGAAFMSAPAGAAALEIKLGIVTTPGSAQHVTAVKFKELAEARSGGDISVKIFHSGSLGSETEILQQVQMRAVEMAIITLGPFDVFVPEVKVVSFPFLFDGFEEADRILDGPLGREVLDSLERAGFKGLAFSENGFRNLTNDVRPVHSAADVEGLKIRVMESNLHKELWRILGANPTPMPWPIYTELAQGTIDGQENPLWVMWVYKLHEVQKYLTLTRHVYSAHIDVANLGWFESLPDDKRQLIEVSMREAAQHQRAWNRANNQDFLNKLKSRGMSVVDRPDLESFRRKAVKLKEMEIYSDPGVQGLLEKFLEAAK
jgi:tripartite ATP-independent transporter DctP family solute receptor